VFVKTHYAKLISQGQWLGGLLCGWIRNTFSENIKCIANEKAKTKTENKNKKGQRTAGNIIINNMQTRRNQCKTR